MPRRGSGRRRSCPRTPSRHEIGNPHQLLKKFLHNGWPVSNAFRKASRMSSIRLEELPRMRDKESPSPKQAAKQWFNQLPTGAIGSFQEFWSFFLHQFASCQKLRKTELSLFAIRQKDNKPLKEYLQRFNTAALEVPSATQEVKDNAFSQGLLDGDFFKSLAKKHVSKFDALLARAAKYINMEDAQASKKESQGEKRKKTKEEAPSKKPQMNLRIGIKE
ncbi:UNVERIFIED_CONTAM: hypothetical protein Slati_1935300 [Sesamum latifolium]|uniref:Retrotransposon gag domain-containing protein n=1 Tax=Sesamum latifolium TaxID=2727402 RepID=A0AAW2X2H3_9LAMI